MGIKVNNKVGFTSHAEEKPKRLLKIGVAKARIMVVTIYPGERRRYE